MQRCQVGPLEGLSWESATFADSHSQSDKKRLRSGRPVVFAGTTQVTESCVGDLTASVMDSFLLAWRTCCPFTVLRLKQCSFSTKNKHFSPLNFLSWNTPWATHLLLTIVAGQCRRDFSPTTRTHMQTLAFERNGFLFYCELPLCPICGDRFWYG